MKFKATIVGCLITALLIGATTAVLLVQEAKQQTKISLEILAEQKRQTESIENAEQEINAQTVLAQKSTELLYIQVRTDTDRRAKEILENEENVSYINNFAHTIVATSNIGKSINEDLWKALIKK